MRTIERVEESLLNRETNCPRCEGAFLVDRTIVEHTACDAVVFEGAFDGSEGECCPKCERRASDDELLVLGTVSVCPDCRGVSDLPLRDGTA